MAGAAFQGFTQDTLKFFKELKENNRKEWFEANRERFERVVLEPAKKFVAEIGHRLTEWAPEVVAVPRIDQSIFRLHRDVRFSKDKRPYKTHFAMFFWEGPFMKVENPGFYLHFDDTHLFTGAGLHQFGPQQLKIYREAVVNPAYGPALAAILSKITEDTQIRLSEPEYKKVPRGFDANHPLADLLRYKGVAGYTETGIPEEFFGPEFLDYILKRWEPLVPLHSWMREVMKQGEMA
ncbi:MAG: DUF2461 domain-containing protein [Calditrichia bacterium]